MDLSVGFFGGAKGDRTPDLMTASHALSQLSYGPTRIEDLTAADTINRARLGQPSL